jgi:hypothetical protein
MIEAADKNGRIGSQGTLHGNTSVFQGVIHILQDQPLLRIQGQKFILGNVEERRVEECRIFREEMPCLDVEL